jgi:hypothetical protein
MPCPVHLQPSLGAIVPAQVACLKLADTVAVVRKGVLVRPVALRLDACGGRWIVTELRWWRNETDTAMTPGRDGGSS